MTAPPLTEPSTHRPPSTKTRSVSPRTSLACRAVFRQSHEHQSWLACGTVPTTTRGPSTDARIQAVGLNHSYPRHASRPAVYTHIPLHGAPSDPAHPFRLLPSFISSVAPLVGQTSNSIPWELDRSTSILACLGSRKDLPSAGTCGPPFSYAPRPPRRRCCYCVRLRYRLGWASFRRTKRLSTPTPGCRWR